MISIFDACPVRTWSLHPGLCFTCYPCASDVRICVSGISTCTSSSSDASPSGHFRCSSTLAWQWHVSCFYSLLTVLMFDTLSNQLCCSVAQSCLTICDPMDCSVSGLPAPHYLPEFAQFTCTELVTLSDHHISFSYLVKPKPYSSPPSLTPYHNHQRVLLTLGLAADTQDPPQQPQGPSRSRSQTMSPIAQKGPLVFQSCTKSNPTEMGNIHVASPPQVSTPSPGPAQNCTQKAFTEEMSQGEGIRKCHIHHSA